MTGRPRRAVVTALFGGYEELAEQPTAAAGDVDLLCFTDDPELRSDTWQVRVVDPALALDPVRSARTVKIRGHEQLEPYDETLWIDARVRLDADPNVVLDEWLADSDFTLPRHSWRPDVVTEFEAVLLGGLDDFARLYEQLSHYSALAPERLQAPVPWTAMLARRRTAAVAAAMETWLLHVQRYSRRDQLSVVHCLGDAGLAHRLVDLDNDRSDLHEWLAPVGRSRRSHLHQLSDSLRAPVAEIGELRLALEAKNDEMLALVAAREARIEELEGIVAALHAEVAEVPRLHHEVAVRDARVAELTAEVAQLRELAVRRSEKVAELRAKVRTLRKK